MWGRFIGRVEAETELTVFNILSPSFFSFSCCCRSITQQGRVAHWSRDGPGTRQAVRAYLKWHTCKNIYIYTELHVGLMNHNGPICLHFAFNMLSSLLSFFLPFLFVLLCSLPLLPSGVQNCPDLSESRQQQQWQRCGGTEGGAEEGLPQEEHPPQEEDGGGKWRLHGRDGLLWKLTRNLWSSEQTTPPGHG